MLSLLRSEWYQVRKMLSVKITFAITLIASVIFGFRMTDGAACLLLASLFAGWLISAAFENRTIQEAISYGKSRTKVYCAKMSLFVLVVNGLCLVYWFGSSMAAFVKYGLGTREIAGNLFCCGFIWRQSPCFDSIGQSTASN